MLGAATLWREVEDGRALVLCLAQLGVDADLALQHELSPRLLDPRTDVIIERGVSAIDTGEQHAEHVELMLEALVDGDDRLDELVCALDRERREIGGDEHVVSGEQRVEGEVPLVGGAVDEDDIVVGACDGEGIAQKHLLADLLGDAPLGLGERGVGGGDVEALMLGGDDGVEDLFAVIVEEDLTKRRVDWPGGEQGGEARGAVPLCVEIDEEHAAVVERGEGAGEVDGAGGLAHAPLDGGDGDDLGVAIAAWVALFLFDESFEARGDELTHGEVSFVWSDRVSIG